MFFCFFFLGRGIKFGWLAIGIILYLCSLWAVRAFSLFDALGFWAWWIDGRGFGRRSEGVAIPSVDLKMCVRWVRILGGCVWWIFWNEGA